jgi:hypothetical protein
MSPEEINLLDIHHHQLSQEGQRSLKPLKRDKIKKKDQEKYYQSPAGAVVITFEAARPGEKPEPLQLRQDSIWILEKLEMIRDDHVKVYLAMIRKSLPSLDRMIWGQDTLFATDRARDLCHLLSVSWAVRQGYHCQQIHHSGAMGGMLHWTISSTWNNCVYWYCSMNSKPNAALKRQLAVKYTSLLNPVVEILCVRMEPQTNLECGIRALDVSLQAGLGVSPAGISRSRPFPVEGQYRLLLESLTTGIPVRFSVDVEEEEGIDEGQGPLVLHPREENYVRLVVRVYHHTVPKKEQRRMDEIYNRENIVLGACRNLQEEESGRLQIRYLSTLKEMDGAVQIITDLLSHFPSDQRVLQVDTEWYVWVRPDLRNVDVVQVATPGEGIWIFHVTDTGVPDALRGLLEDDTIVKVGKAIISADASMLRRRNVTMTNMVDLNVAAYDAGIVKSRKLSLAKLFAVLCGGDLDKLDRLSDWRKKPLPPNLIQYASRDVWVSLQCWRAIMVVKSRENRPVKRRKFSAKNLKEAIVVTADSDHEECDDDTNMERIMDLRVKLGLDRKPVHTCMYV